MPMSFDQWGQRIVDERVILAECRKRLAADLVRQQRIRSRAGDTPPGELLDLLSMSSPTSRAE